MSMDADPVRILFYDGECGLCQRSVRFLMRRDRAQRPLYFAPLQGETAAAFLPDSLRKELSTAVYRDADGVCHERSSAILRAIYDSATAWHLLAQALLWLPLAWRDASYRSIARNRHRLGMKQVCLRPNEEEKKRLLP